MDALAAWVVFEACGPDFVNPVQTGTKTKKTKKKKSKKRKKKEPLTSPDNKKEPATPTRRSSRIRTNHRLTYTSGVPRKHIKTQRCPVCLTFISAFRRTGICSACNSKLIVQGTSIVVDLVSDGSDEEVADEEVDPKDKKKPRPLQKWKVPKLSDLKPGDAVSVRIPLSVTGKYTKVPRNAWLTGLPFQSRIALTRSEKRDSDFTVMVYPVTTDLSDIRTDKNTYTLREFDSAGRTIITPRRGDDLKTAKDLCTPNSYRYVCSKKDKKIVDDITDPDQGSEYDVVCTGFTTNIYRTDIRRLRDKQKLNDEIICFFILLLKSKYDKVHVFNTFFMSKLCDGWEGHDPEKLSKVKFVFEAVSKWTRNVNVLQNKWIFIPINVKPTQHWVAIAVNMYDKVMYFLDSLGPCLGKHDYLSATQYWIEKEMTSRTEVEEISESYWDDWELRDVDNRQENGYDCGVFVCMNLWCLVNNVPLSHTRQENILSFRQLMTLSILRKNIPPAL